MCTLATNFAILSTLYTLKFKLKSLQFIVSSFLFWYANRFCFLLSELLYPEGSISPNSGIAADILCKGRDYLVSSTQKGAT